MPIRLWLAPFLIFCVSNAAHAQNSGEYPVPPEGIPSAPAIGTPGNLPPSGASEEANPGDGGNSGSRAQPVDPTNPSPNVIVPKTEPDEETPAAAPETVPPVDLVSARINLPAVVEAYIARHSTRGVWTIKEKSGKIWQLKQPKTLADTTRNSGPGLFSAHVLMNTAKPPRRQLDLNFTVDFSGADWKVQSYRLVKIDGKTPK